MSSSINSQHSFSGGFRKTTELLLLTEHVVNEDANGDDEGNDILDEHFGIDQIFFSLFFEFYSFVHNVCAEVKIHSDDGAAKCE